MGRGLPRLLFQLRVFASPERDRVFDLRSRREASWSVRVGHQGLAASFILAARDRGFKRKGGPQRRACSAAEVQGCVAKTSMKAASKLTEVVDGRPQFPDEPPLLSRSAITEEYRRRVKVAFADYRATLLDDRRRLIKRYRLVDVASKVVGVGSVGSVGTVRRDPFTCPRPGSRRRGHQRLPRHRRGIRVQSLEEFAQVYADQASRTTCGCNRRSRTGRSRSTPVSERAARRVAVSHGREGPGTAS